MIPVRVLYNLESVATHFQKVCLSTLNMIILMWFHLFWILILKWIPKNNVIYKLFILSSLKILEFWIPCGLGSGICRFELFFVAILAISTIDMKLEINVFMVVKGSKGKKKVFYDLRLQYILRSYGIPEKLTTMITQVYENFHAGV